MKLDDIVYGNPVNDYTVENDSIGYTDLWGIPHSDKRDSYVEGTLSMRVKLDPTDDFETLKDGIIEDGLTPWMEFACGRNVELETPVVELENGEVVITVDYVANV